MKRLIALILLATMPILAQSGRGSIRGEGRISSGVSAINSGSGIIGLIDGSYNLAFNDSNNVIEGMRFVNSQFQQKSPLPNAAADSCTSVYNNKIYIIGGYGTSSSTQLDFVQIYDPTTDIWTQGSVLPVAEWGAACAVYNGKIYLFGGVVSGGGGGGGGTANAYLYDIAGDSWSSLTSLPSAIPDGMMGVTVGSDIYLLFESNFWRFDPSAAGGMGSYTALTAAPTAAQVQWAATGYVNVSGDDRIYFIGGSTSAGSGYGNGNYYYSVTNSAWSGAQAAAPFSAHGQLQGAVLSGQIYYIAGYDGTVFWSDLYAYNPSTNSWSSKLATMSQWRDGVAGGFYGNTIYVIGGRNANAPNAFGISANEAYQVGSTVIPQTFTKIQLHYSSPSGGNVHLGIYSDSGGAPGSLILDAGAVSIVNGWTAITGLSLSSLTLGTNYWLVFLQDSFNNISYTSGAPSGSVAGAHCSTTGTSYGSLPSTFPAVGMTCQVGSMYAEKLSVN